MDLKATQKISYGVYIVTTWRDGKPTGCIANSAMQVTAVPATIAVSINHANYTNECIKSSGKFAISILAEDSDPTLIGTFGFKSGRDTDKFAGIERHILGNMPVIPDGCGAIVCNVINTMETETHTVFLGEIVEAEAVDGRTPMTYDYYHNAIKGKSPRTAPTYVAEDGAPAPATKKTRKYRCKICGYEYEGESLPADIVCPICGVGADMFEEVD